MKHLHHILTILLLLGTTHLTAEDETKTTEVFTNLPEHYFDDDYQIIIPPTIDPPTIHKWKNTRSICVVGYPDQIDAVRAAILGPPSQGNLHILVETIEVEHQYLQEWLLENPIKSDATPLHDQLHTWIRKGRARHINTDTIVCGSGQRALTRSGTEYIYPHSHDPPEIPNQLHLDGKNHLKTTPSGFTSFERRDLGSTFEVDPVLGLDRVTVDLNLAPQRVQHHGDTWWPAPEESDTEFQIRKPTFTTQKVTTQITTHDGTYALLGGYIPDKSVETEMRSPFHLVFARADVSTKEEKPTFAEE